MDIPCECSYNTSVHKIENGGAYDMELFWRFFWKFEREDKEPSGVQVLWGKGETGRRDKAANDPENPRGKKRYWI